MTKRVLMLALACALAVLFVNAGCSGDGTTLGPSGTPDTTMDGDDGDGGDNGDNGDNGDTTVTLATLSAEIFTPNCATAGCHAGPNASNGMSLEAGVIMDPRSASPNYVRSHWATPPADMRG